MLVVPRSSRSPEISDVSSGRRSTLRPYSVVTGEGGGRSRGMYSEKSTEGLKTYRSRPLSPLPPLSPNAPLVRCTRGDGRRVTTSGPVS